MVEDFEDIDPRSLRFAVEIIKFVRTLPRNDVATWKIGGQIISSSTSVHSNIVQARAGISRKDFINHMRIARKEAKETQKWIELMLAAGIGDREKLKALFPESREIVTVLYAIVNKAEINLKKEQEKKKKK